MGDAYFPEKGEKVLEDALGVKVAIMLMQGYKKNQIAKELSISPNKVTKLTDTEECRRTIRKLETEALSIAKTDLRIGISRLIRKTLAVIEKHLDEGNLQAVPHVFKGLGITEETTEVKDANITIVLPGQSQGDVINITPERDDEV